MNRVAVEHDMNGVNLQDRTQYDQLTSIQSIELHFSQQYSLCAHFEYRSLANILLW